jgi:hypothetical protein
VVPFNQRLVIVIPMSVDRFAFHRQPDARQQIAAALR